jgi:putative heme-binding domain-containing protein
MRALLGFDVPSTDHNFPLMLWYGMEPWVATQPAEAARVYALCRHRQVRQFMARRLGERLPGDVTGLEGMLVAAAKAGRDSTALQQDLLRGLADALNGIRRSSPPNGWDRFVVAAKESTDAEVQARLRELSVVFGDGRAAADLRRVAADTSADPAARRQALKALVESRAEGVAPLLKSAVQDGALRPTALIGLLELGDPEGPARAVANYPWLGLEERPAVLNALCGTPAAARALLEAVAAGTVPRTDLTAFQARQIAGLKEPALSARLAEVWGAVRPPDPDRRAAIDRMRSRLAPAVLKAADLVQGQASFRQLCAPCHRLYGAGGEIGPDLTGSGRQNLDYLLENVMDPNAVVPAGFRLTTATLKDGRSLSGILRDETARTITLQAPGQTQAIDRAEIQTMETSNQSMMPEGLLEGLPFESARNLLAFLMNPAPISTSPRPVAN